VNAPHPRRISNRTLLAVAATSLFALALLFALLFGWLLADKPANALPSETQLECSTITHAHQAWLQSTTDLNNTINELNVKRSKDDTDAYYRAVDNRTDQPAKTLAVAVAQYEAELGKFALPHDLGGGPYDLGSHWKTANASTEVVTAYDTFRQTTCG